jgi:hypothetical protein
MLHPLKQSHAFDYTTLQLAVDAGTERIVQETDAQNLKTAIRHSNDFQVRL